MVRSWRCTDIMWADGAGIAQMLSLIGARPLWQENGRVAVAAADIMAAALALPHRMKRLPFEEIGREGEKHLATLAEIRD
jgi:hypothetical protein